MRHTRETRRLWLALGIPAVAAALFLGGSAAGCESSVAAGASSVVGHGPSDGVEEAEAGPERAGAPGTRIAASDAVVLFRDGDSLTRALAERVAAELAGAADGLDRADVRVAPTPFVPGAGERVPDLVVLVDIVEDERSSGMLRSQREVKVAITGARSPGCASSKGDSPLQSAGFQILSDVRGAVAPGLFRTPPDRLVVERVGEHVRGPAGALAFIEAPESSEPAAPPLATTPPLDLGVAAELVYLGARRDGSSEARWQFETSGSHAAAISALVAEAEASGWTRVDGTVFGDRRPCDSVLERGSDELHITRAFTPGIDRSGPGAPDRLAVTVRRAP